MVYSLNKITQSNNFLKLSVIKNRILKLKDGFIPNELNNDVTFGKRINVANNEKKSKNTIKIKG